MAGPQVFVSFSSEDMPFVRRLFDRIAAHEVSLWNYQSREQEIAVGAPLERTLQQQIDASQIFVPVVSSSAFRSKYVLLELTHALNNRNRNRPISIWPLVSEELIEKPVERWPDGFQPVADVKSQLIQFESTSSLEKAMVAFCKRFEIEYHPPTPDLFRFPFMSRFVREVQRRCPRQREYEIDVYRKLMILLSQFSESVERKDYRLASREIRHFISTCEYEFAEQDFYFPYVAKGVCELLQNQLAEARETFESLRNHPQVDENVFGALGAICQQQGEHDAAVKEYRQALQRDPTDFAAKLGVAVNSAMNGQRLPFRSDLILDEISRHEEELRQAGVNPSGVTAFFLDHSGQTDAAIATLEELVREDAVNTTYVIQLAQLLEKSGRRKKAIELLHRFQNRDAGPQIIHHLATYYGYEGDEENAIRYFDKLVKDYPNNRQFHMEAAQVLWQVGKKKKAKTLAAEVISGPRFGLPASAEDFYYDGFANWICGNVNRAEYDFERSGFPVSWHYSALLEM